MFEVAGTSSFAVSASSFRLVFANATWHLHRSTCISRTWKMEKNFWQKERWCHATCVFRRVASVGWKCLKSNKSSGKKVRTGNAGPPRSMFPELFEHCSIVPFHQPKTFTQPYSNNNPPNHHPNISPSPTTHHRVFQGLSIWSRFRSQVFVHLYTDSHGLGAAEVWADVAVQCAGMGSSHGRLDAGRVQPAEKKAKRGCIGSPKGGGFMAEGNYEEISKLDLFSKFQPANFEGWLMSHVPKLKPVLSMMHLPAAGGYSRQIWQEDPHTEKIQDTDALLISLYS